ENERDESTSTNVGDLERVASVVAGGLLGLMGLRSRSIPGLGLAILGGGLIYRGISGHCGVYQSLGISSAKEPSPQASIPAGEGIRIDRSITVNKSPSELFRIWHDFEGLPRFMSHLISVKN